MDIERLRALLLETSGSRKVGDYSQFLTKNQPEAKSLYRHVKKNPHRYTGRLGSIAVSSERGGKMVRYRAPGFTVAKKKETKPMWTIPKRVTQEELLAEAKNWMKDAVKRPGAFRAKAEKAGMSTSAFASKVLSNKDSYDPRTVKQASLARTFSKFRNNKMDEAYIVDPVDSVAINSIYNKHPRLLKKINKWEKRSLRYSKIARALRLSKDDDLDVVDRSVDYSTAKAHKWLNRRKKSPEYAAYDRARKDLLRHPKFSGAGVNESVSRRSRKDILMANVIKGKPGRWDNRKLSKYPALANVKASSRVRQARRSGPPRALPFTSADRGLTRYQYKIGNRIGRTERAIDDAEAFGSALSQRTGIVNPQWDDDHIYGQDPRGNLKVLKVKWA